LLISCEAQSGLLAQEHPKAGYDPRKGVHAEDDLRKDEGRKAEEKEVTRASELARGNERTVKQGTDFHDANYLDKKLNGKQEQSSPEAWKANQAEHVWNDKGKQGQFKAVGIDSKEKLSQHLQDVRDNPDIQSTRIHDNAKYYGKTDKGSDSGTIVIDNPSAKNGGTAFWTPNVHERFQDVNRSTSSKEQK
jgi:hypothetical protein